MQCFTMTDGWLDKPVKQVKSPNFNERPANTEISLLVVHNISLPPNRFGSEDIECFFCNQLDASKDTYFETIQSLQVSAHCLIKRTGHVVQFVDFDARAWHAGRSSFMGQDECNDYSIGIELEGADNLPFSKAQYHALAALIKTLQQHYPAITDQRITGHSDIAPGRKTDPGPCFNWAYLQCLLREML